MANKIQQYFRIGNIFLFICAILCLICYDIHGGLWLKGVTSSWFVMLGLFNLVYARKMEMKKSRFLVLIELGLVSGMCADVLLGAAFIFGILFFAFGHMLYLTAFYSLEKFSKRDLYIIVPIAIISLFVVTGTPYIQIKDPFIKKLLLGYAVIIACMLGKAISNFIKNKSTSRKLLLVGSAMFWFSDVMLAIDMFGKSCRVTWVLCSYNYWPAQCILACSLFFYVNECCVVGKMV